MDEVMREFRQEGQYPYTIGPFHKPIATVKPGETFNNYPEDFSDSKTK